jgi:hypothetical protein
MKITEPKTPYAKQYDPMEDEEEIEAINASEVIVDELDQVKGKKAMKVDDIPDIDLGEPENPTLEHSRTPEGERRVVVDPDQHDEGFHGEELAGLTAEEREKHAKFEAARKKHYEMRNVKNLLGYVSSTGHVYTIDPIANLQADIQNNLTRSKTRTSQCHHAVSTVYNPNPQREIHYPSSLHARYFFPIIIVVIPRLSLFATSTCVNTWRESPVIACEKGSGAVGGQPMPADRLPC